MELLLPLVVFAVMWFLLIVPQRKKQKAQQDLMSSLAPGDEVLTTGGIYGGITEVDGDDIYLEIAHDVEIKVTRRAIADRVSPASPASEVKAGGKPGKPSKADKTDKTDSSQPQDMIVAEGDDDTGANGASGANDSKKK
jgi:preprotein translocase subunit YajC